jgi:hypothetical protein
MKLSNTKAKGTHRSTPQSNPRDDETTIMYNMDRIMELVEENRRLQKGGK